MDIYIVLNFVLHFESVVILMSCSRKYFFLEASIVKFSQNCHLHTIKCYSCLHKTCFKIHLKTAKDKASL